MVIQFLTVLLVSFLMIFPVWAAPGRQLCLSCHPAHYSGSGSCTNCHQGNPASGRKNIAHQRLIAGRYARFTMTGDPVLREGNRLLDQYACRRCHVIGGTGNKLSANLDHATARRLPEEMSESIRRPVQNMPNFRVQDEQAVAVVNVLLSAARQQSAVAVRPQVVHFDQAGSAGKDVFSIKCGPCHRLLTSRLGGLGRGDAGPNLSGLLSSYYPKSFRNREAWNADRLRRWLENPRAIRPGAQMLPVKLSETELRDLLEIVRVENRN